jgi:hypothetical protein
MGHKPTSAGLFDYLVGEQLHLAGNGQAERLGGLEVDDEFEIGGLHHRQVGGLRAFEDAAAINRSVLKSDLLPSFARAACAHAGK